MNNCSLDLDVKYHVSDVEDDTERFRNAAAWVMDLFGLQELSASIAIVDDPTIHELNRAHLNHDWPTDVISFVFENDGVRVDGEIIASSDTARKLCREAGWKHADEILLYVIHGFLHIAGLDDLNDAERKTMRQREQECLLALGVTEAAEHLKRWEDISY